MPEFLSPEQNSLKQSIDRFIAERLRPLDRQLDESNADSIREQVIQASKDAGLFTMTQPKAYGGTEAGLIELTLVRETLAASNTRIARWVLGPGPGVLAGATGHLKEHFLDPVMSGAKRGAFGFTEPDGAERPTWADHDGDSLVVHGCKSYVTGGDTADFTMALINVQASGDQPKGTAMVAIERDTPGVTIDEVFESLDGSTHVSMTFDGARIPKENVIGEIGQGMPRALRQIGDVRIMVSAQATGMMMWALDYLEEMLQAPHRSGSPLSSREGVRLRFADLRIQAYAARSMLYRTCRLGAAGENIVNEAIATKVFATEAAGRVIDECMQLCGGKALTVGHPIERLYRQVRALRFTEGASDLLRINLAKGRFELNKGRV